MAIEDMGTRWNPSAPQMPAAPSIIDLAGLTAGALNADLIAAVDVSCSSSANGKYSIRRWI